MMGVGEERLVVPVGDGRRVEVLVWGEANTATVVLHMGTPNGLVPLPARFTEGPRARFVAWARPGYGASTAHPGRSVADVAGDTACIVDGLGVDEFVTAGWSGGGPHALACAALLPGRCLATAIVAGPAPCAAGVQNWTDTKMGFALRGDEPGLVTALEVDQAASTTLHANAVAEMFTSEPDRAALSSEYADWLVDYIQAAYAAGIMGARDDWLALARDWGFELADAHNVTFWHGDRDDNVVLANSTWLADHVPDSELRMVSGEGHMSIASHFPEILQDLLERSRPAPSSL